MATQPRSNDLLPVGLIVGVGASAGGLAAFKTFLANTPADCGMAFILVQHLDPHHKTLLVELLRGAAPIPVLEATDGDAIRKNCVFVIPRDATLTIKDGILRVVTPAPPRGLRRPIDTFFASLAQDCGEKAVAIVLSGVGSDGALGVRMIKEHGGLTLAQAEFNHVAQSGMPQSAADTGAVDYVVPVEAMPALLIEQQRHLGAFAEHRDGNGIHMDVSQHLAAIAGLLRAAIDVIAERELNKIFETFYTTKPEGTGLGLSIARNIIESYGGKIWAERRPGGGTSFHFNLPLAQPR